MSKRKSFLLYDDLYDTIQYLNDEQLGRLMRMVFDYRINNVVCDISDPLFFCFNPIRVQLDRDGIKYEDVIEKRSIAGKASAESRANKKQHMLTHVESVEQNEQVSTSPTDSVNVNDNVSVSDNESDIINIAKATKSNFKNWTSREFAEDIKKNGKGYTPEMLTKFYDTYSELSAKGVMKFQLNKTWETKKRLARWKDYSASFDQPFEKKNIGPAAAPNTFSRASNGVHYK